MLALVATAGSLGASIAASYALIRQCVPGGAAISILLTVLTGPGA